jgi:hypothetical protein
MSGLFATEPSSESFQEMSINDGIELPPLQLNTNKIRQDGVFTMDRRSFYASTCHFSVIKTPL